MWDNREATQKDYGIKEASAVSGISFRVPCLNNENKQGPEEKGGRREETKEHTPSTADSPQRAR